MSNGRFAVLLYRFHASVGLITGLFLFVICSTGIVAIFRPQIERAADWSGYDFNVVATGEPISMDDALRAVLAAYPSAEIVACEYPAPPGATASHGPTYRLSLRRGGQAIQVLLDPYTCRIVAAKVGNDGWGNWLRQLHVRFLYFGFWGRVVVGFFGVLMLALTITGLLIYGKFNRGAWWPKIRWGRGARIVVADLHKAVGIASLAFNLLFGLTGAVLGLENLAHRYVMQKPKAVTSRPVVVLPSGMIDKSVLRTQEILPGTRPTQLRLTHKQDGCLRVFVGHSRGDLVPENTSYVAFAAGTGEVLEVYDARKSSAAARVYYAMIPLHFGRFGGTGVKLVWAMMGLSASFLSISGCVIYILRKSARSPIAAAVPNAVRRAQPTT